MAAETRRVPALAPYDIPRLVCTECGNLLRVQVTVQNNRKLTGVKAFCDTCKYLFKLSTPHGIGEISSGGYEVPNEKAQPLEENIEIIGLLPRAKPAPQVLTGSDPRQQAPGGQKPPEEPKA